MYKLALTHAERQAIDFVGYRYEHGDELRSILHSQDCRWSVEFEPRTLDEVSWEHRGDILFELPEHLAWEMKELLEDCRYDLFGSELVTKFLTFLEKIV
jgi:hypothetical protein